MKGHKFSNSLCVLFFVVIPFVVCLDLDVYGDGYWGVLLNNIVDLKCEFNLESTVDLGEELTLYWYDASSGLNKSYALSNAYAEVVVDENFNSSVPWIFYTHGFGASISSDGTVAMIDALLQIEDTYIFVLDHSNLTKKTLLILDSYQSAVSYIRPIARNLKSYWFDEFIGIVSADNIHLIGHSLGAQIFGNLGYLLNQNGTSIKKCTGLDPAGPCFSIGSDEVQFSSGDCEFTEVIHTNFGQLGTDLKLSDFEAMANCAGKLQPYCFEDVCYAKTLIVQSFLYTTGITSSCSHSYSVTAYANSVRDSYIGTQCDDYQTFINGGCSNSTQVKVGFGSDASMNYTGVYFFKTEDCDCDLN